MHAGGWSNLEMLTRRYGKHSFASHREKLSDKMDMFLDGKTEMDSTSQDTEAAQKLLQDLLRFT